LCSFFGHSAKHVKLSESENIMKLVGHNVLDFKDKDKNDLKELLKPFLDLLDDKTHYCIYEEQSRCATGVEEFERVLLEWLPNLLSQHMILTDFAVSDNQLWTEHYSVMCAKSQTRGEKCCRVTKCHAMLTLEKDDNNNIKIRELHYIPHLKLLQEFMHQCRVDPPWEIGTFQHLKDTVGTGGVGSETGVGVEHGIRSTLGNILPTGESIKEKIYGSTHGSDNIKDKVTSDEELKDKIPSDEQVKDKIPFSGNLKEQIPDTESIKRKMPAKEDVENTIPSSDNVHEDTVEKTVSHAGHHK